MNRARKDYRNKEKLRALYGSYSIREIGALYGVSGNAIWLWLKKFGIRATIQNEEPRKIIQDLRSIGLSSEEIAQITNIHRTQIYRLKKGTSKRPNFSTLRKLTKVHRRLVKGSEK